MTVPAEPTLIDKVDELTGAVDRATAAVEHETTVRRAETEALRLKFFTARRAFRVSLLVAAIVVTAGAVAGAAILCLTLSFRHEVERREADRVDAAVVSCKNANESRQAIEDRMEQLVTQLGNTNAPTDPTAKAVREQAIARFLDEFRASMPAALQPRDCSPQAATSPTLVQR